MTRVSPGPGEAQEGFAQLEAALPSRLDDRTGSSIGGTSERNIRSGRDRDGDPHKRSATIEVMTADDTVVGGGRFATDRDGYLAMVRYAQQWPQRV